MTSYHHYHYQLYGTGYRRMDLKSTWSFDCICKRCSDPTESGTLVSAVICDKCKFGSMLPKVSTDYKSKWLCDHCEEETDAELVEQKVNILYCVVLEENTRPIATTYVGSFAQFVRTKERGHHKMK